MLEPSIPQRLAAVHARVAESARRAGRPTDAVRLVAVSKTQPASLVREAYAAGHRHFGENYAQELSAKAEALSDLPELSWHFIGPLQRNKAKRVAPLAAFVHTVDRAPVAIALSARAATLGRKLPVLVEVNVSGEASKAGSTPDDAAGLCETIDKLPGLVAVGLMTIPPLGAEAAVSRPIFAALRALRDRIGGGLTELSMGMSHDFDVAIEEGATIVRVGTAIFGARAPTS